MRGREQAPMISTSEHSGRSASWGSEWSDPRDETATSPTPPSAASSSNNSHVEQENGHPPSLVVEQSDGDSPGTIRRSASSSSFGISIPSFLQPLLGLDFVPFYPAATNDEQEQGEDEEVMSAFEEALMEPYDDEEDAVAKGNVGLFLDIPETPSLLSPSTAPTPVRGSTSRRKERREKFKSAIGSTFKAIKSSGSSGTSRRRLRANSRDSSSPHLSLELEWMNREQEQLAQHQRHLERVQKDAETIQQRAGEIEHRMGQLRSQAFELQRAMDRCSQELQQETRSLNSTNRELSRLEEEAVRTGQLVQQTVSSIRKNSERPRKATGDRTATSRRLSLNNLRKPPLHRERSATDSNVQIPTSYTPSLLMTPPPAAAKSPTLSSSMTSPEVLQSNRPRANTEPRRLRRLESSPASFMRVSDLTFKPMKEDDDSSPSPPSSARSSPACVKEACADGEFFFIDKNLQQILDSLFQLGYEVVTDESDRFAPTADTRKLLAKQEYAAPESVPDWPFQSWYVPRNQDVLVWTGGVPHEGHGHDWPVVKARGIVQTATRNLLEFLLDSSQIGRYNRISKGRYDLLVLQSGVETTAEESDFGFAGDARILRALNKPRLLPKTIEMLSLWYSCQLECDLGHPPDSYMIVSRSVWEDEFGTPPQDFTMIRSEMLLGVQLLRPCNGGQACELTTITHVYSPGVPEMLAKRKAPGSAESMVRDLQEIFR